MIRIVTLLKWTLFAVVLAFVTRYGYRLWLRDEVQTSLRAASAGWLAVAALLYALSSLPSVWFWRMVMAELGGRVRFWEAARAYYCGHLGKYVPGKAMVVVIRAAMVKDRGCPLGTATLAVFVETLTMMATGVVAGLFLAPLQQWVPRDLQWGLAAVSFVTLALMVPLGPRLIDWVLAKVAVGRGLPAPNVGIQPRTLAAGMIAFVLAWLMQGLSLGATLQAVADSPVALDHVWCWTGAMALSTSLGFAVLFAPAGLGVREAILLGALVGEGGINTHAAIATTVLARLVSLVSELAVSAVLYPSALTKNRVPPSPLPADNMK